MCMHIHSAHTYMSAYMQEYVYYAQACDCVVKSVLHLQLLPTLLCVGRDVLGCCQLAVWLLSALLSLQTANFDQDVLT